MNNVLSSSVAIIGPGAVGCVCAAAIKRGGRPEPVLYGRRSGAESIRVEQVGFDPATLPPPVTIDRRPDPEPADVVLLAVKAHQTPGAAAWLARLCGPSTLVAVLQNGVEHIERVSAFVGTANVLPVVVHGTATMVEPGRVVCSTPVSLQTPVGSDALRFAALFEGSGVSVEPVDDFVTAQWRKLCVNAVSAIMAITGRTSEVFRGEGAAGLARALAREVIAVGRAAGARIDDGYADEVVADFQSLPDGTVSSILTDRLAGRPLEWDARNGVVQRLGIRYGVATPVSDVLVPLLAAATG